jgi:hypothetical protein
MQHNFLAETQFNQLEGTLTPPEARAAAPSEASAEACISPIMQTTEDSDSQRVIRAAEAILESPDEVSVPDTSAARDVGRIAQIGTTDDNEATSGGSQVVNEDPIAAWERLFRQRGYLPEAPDPVEQEKLAAERRSFSGDGRIPPEPPEGQVEDPDENERRAKLRAMWTNYRGRVHDRFVQARVLDDSSVPDEYKYEAVDLILRRMADMTEPFIETPGEDSRSRQSFPSAVDGAAIGVAPLIECSFAPLISDDPAMAIHQQGDTAGHKVGAAMGTTTIRLHTYNDEGIRDVSRVYTITDGRAPTDRRDPLDRRGTLTMSAAVITRQQPGNRAQPHNPVRSYAPTGSEMAGLEHLLTQAQTITARLE